MVARLPKPKKNRGKAEKHSIANKGRQNQSPNIIYCLYSAMALSAATFKRKNKKPSAASAASKKKKTSPPIVAIDDDENTAAAADRNNANQLLYEAKALLEKDFVINSSKNIL